MRARLSSSACSSVWIGEVSRFTTTEAPHWEPQQVQIQQGDTFSWPSESPLYTASLSYSFPFVSFIILCLSYSFIQPAFFIHLSQPLQMRSKHITDMLLQPDWCSITCLSSKSLTGTWETDIKKECSKNIKWRGREKIKEEQNVEGKRRQRTDALYPHPSLFPLRQVRNELMLNTGVTTWSPQKGWRVSVDYEENIILF